MTRVIDTTERGCVNGCGRRGTIPIVRHKNKGRAWHVAAWLCGTCRSRFKGEYHQVLIRQEDLEAWTGARPSPQDR